MKLGRLCLILFEITAKSKRQLDTLKCNIVTLIPKTKKGKEEERTEGKEKNEKKKNEKERRNEVSGNDVNITPQFIKLSSSHCENDSKIRYLLKHTERCHIFVYLH